MMFEKRSIFSIVSYSVYKPLFFFGEDGGLQDIFIECLNIEKVTNFSLLCCCSRQVRTTFIIDILHFEGRQPQDGTNPIL